MNLSGPMGKYVCKKQENIMKNEHILTHPTFEMFSC